MKIEPVTKYILNRGAYCLRSKWPLRIKVTIAAALLISALTITSNQPAPNLTTYTEQKLTYVDYIVSQGKANRTQAQKITEATLRWARELEVDEKLVLAIGKVESNFDYHAISSSGAMGVMQVIPRWHEDKIRDAKKIIGTPEVFNIETNIYLGTRVIKDCIDRFKLLSKVLLCYSGNTVGYDKKVLAEYNIIKRL